MYLKHLGLRSWTAAIIPLLSIAEASAQVLSREEAIRIATERNPAVIAARGQWNAARARVSQARALPDPELELEYEELPGGFSLREFGERNIGFSQTIEFPVRWWLRNRAARQSASATKMSAFEMTKLEVATRVKVAYDRVLLNQRLLDYAEQNLTLAQDLLDKARVRFEAGDVPQLEILRAEVEAGRATNRVTVARNDLSKSKAALNALLARDIRASLTVVGDLSTRPVEVNVERLKALAVERRPDLLGARSALAGAQSLRSSAISSFLPDLNLSVFRQTFQEASGREGFWHVSFGLEVPLWGLFRQRGRSPRPVPRYRAPLLWRTPPATGSSWTWRAPFSI